MYSVATGERGGALVFPHEVNAGHRTPGRADSRAGRKPRIVSCCCCGEKEAGDRVPLWRVGGWGVCPIATKMPVGDCFPKREGRRQSCSLTRLMPVIVVPSL